MIPERLKEMDVGFEPNTDEFRAGLPLLVMIHGAGGSSRIWTKQTKGLSGAVNPFALDLPGHGKTGTGAMSDMGDYASWLKEVLVRAFEAPVILMGHSMGGAIVQEAALLYPELLIGIILVATGPRLQVAPSFLEGFSSRFEKTVDLVMEYAFASGTDPSIVEEGARAMKEAGPGVVSDDFSACNRFDRRKDVQNIELPCLIICGQEDKLTPVKLSRGLNESIRNSRFQVVPSAGHFVMLEKPEMFNGHVRNFIESITGDPRP